MCILCVMSLDHVVLRMSKSKLRTNFPSVARIFGVFDRVPVGFPLIDAYLILAVLIKILLN